MKKLFKYSLIAIVVVTVYLVTAVPVGLYLYSMKMDLGINIFSNAGFHSYLRCLKEEAKKMDEEIR